jgi:1-acyl-sn-glycerol-3-phosphate acyltransferase
VSLLYDAVANGMWAYSHAAFRVRVLGPRRFPLRPRTLLVVTHRRETDVPVFCPAVYFGAELWRHPGELERMSFAARDDMFLPGFFAGFPPGLSPRVRRVLYPLGVARWLPVVQVHPLRSADVARLGEVLRERRGDELAAVAPAAAVDDLRARAREAGLAEPRRAGDALRGEYADILWRPVGRGDLGERLEDVWARRAAQAAADFRTLVELVRAGGSLVVFPEGRPSPDGEIGPLRRGLGALVRRSRPEWIRPFCFAYDPLVRGRTLVYLGIGVEAPPPADDVEPRILALLRRTTPLTVGQVVAHTLLRGAGTAAEAEASLAERVREAWRHSRPFEPRLRDPRERRERVAEALAAADAKKDELPFLARELESAWAAR